MCPVRASFFCPFADRLFCACACVRVMLQWMSKCIGRKNFRYFIVFNVLVACYIAELVVIALCYP